jgi:hypothetical protein
MYRNAKENEPPMKSRLIGLGLIAILATPAWAHPGHSGTDASQPIHYVASWEHASVLVCMLVATWVASRWLAAWGLAAWVSLRATKKAFETRTPS